MVHTETDRLGLHITLRPNCSASWAENRRILVTLSLVSLFAAAGLLAMGAWLVFPSLALAITCMGYLLRQLSVKQAGEQQHIDIGDAALDLEIVSDAQRHWHWSRAGSRILLTEQRYPNDPLEIALCHRGEIVRVGAFLNREDSTILLHLLRTHGLTVSRYREDAQLKA